MKLRLDVQLTPNLKTATIWGTLPGTTDENVMVVAHRDGWFEGANDNGTGVATLLGIAEYFAKIPAAQRRRTITFIGTTGHHDGTAESGTWLLQHQELFAKTALLINCEHTAANQLVAYNGTVRKATRRRRSCGTSAAAGARADRARRLRDLRRADLRPRRTRRRRRDRPHPEPRAVDAADRHRPLLALGSRNAGHHSADGLAATTRAYAKIIADVNGVDLQDLQRPAAPK